MGLSTVASAKVEQLGDYRDQLEELRPWLDLERFDARALNRALAALPVLPEERVA